MSTSCADGGSSRVSIPHHLRKTLQTIREITGKQHSDEDIFSVYQDSFNDPHETAQKLLFLDTFHEVRSKREKRKENIVLTTPASGRSGRRNLASSKTYQGNGRSASFKRENGVDNVTGGPRPALPATNKARNITVPSEIKVSGPTSLPSEDRNHKVQDDPSFISPSSRCSSQSDRVTEIETASIKGRTQSPLKSDVSEQRSHVTFPFHLQVAKGLQNGLTFGSFDSNFVKEITSNKGASGGDDSSFELTQGAGDDEKELSPTTNGIPGVASARESTFSEDKGYGISNSAREAELVVHSNHIVPPVENVMKEESLSNTESHQNAYGQEAPLSLFGLVPSFSALGQPVNTEAAETQPGNSSVPALSLISYPPHQLAIAAASQQATHLLSQQYPPNFYPYGPYYPPYYMPPPYIHQFLSPNGIPQQSYFPAGAALAAPSHAKPVGNTENLPTTNSLPHASSTSATHIPSATASNSIHIEEKASPLTENAAAWIGQGLGNLQVNPMYNLALQGQPLSFPVVQAGHGGLMGIHQLTQPMAAVSTAYQTLPPAPHTTTAMVEPMGHPNMAYQQPQAVPTNWVNNY